MKYNKAEILYRHGNGLPEKPTAHQAGRPCDTFIIIKHDNREQKQTHSGQTERVQTQTNTDMDRSQV